MALPGAVPACGLAPQQLRLRDPAQGQAEAYLEQLHSVAEKDLKRLQRLMEDPQSTTAGQLASEIVADPKWPQFRQTLIGLTDVTRSHFNKLVEVGLPCWVGGGGHSCLAAPLVCQAEACLRRLLAKRLRQAAAHSEHAKVRMSHAHALTACQTSCPVACKAPRRWACCRSWRRAWQC